MTETNARALAIRDHLLRLLGAPPCPRSGEINAGAFRAVLRSDPRVGRAGSWPHRLWIWTKLPRSPDAEVNVLHLAWDEAGAHAVEHFERGAWKGDALSLRPPAAGRRAANARTRWNP
jgi:hypothetical protein